MYIFSPIINLIPYVNEISNDIIKSIFIKSEKNLILLDELITHLYINF